MVGRSPVISRSLVLGMTGGQAEEDGGEAVLYICATDEHGHR
ncbi:hypothetical protein [Streptomyces sp. NPDC058382]